MNSENILAQKGIAIGDIVQYSNKGFYRIVRCIKKNSYVELKAVMNEHMMKTSNRTIKGYAENCVKVNKDELVAKLRELIKLVESIFEVN